MNAEVVTRRARPTSRRSGLTPFVVTLALSTAACATPDDNASIGTAADADAPIALRDGVGPHVNAPDRAMAMTLDAVEIAGDDILMRLRVENSDDNYLDMGVQDTIYGPLLVMRDDRDNQYESLAVEPAGVPGRRIADLSGGERTRLALTACMANPVNLLVMLTVGARLARGEAAAVPPGSARGLISSR